MRTAWTEGGERREVVSPVSLIVSAFAPCDDVRGTLTPSCDATAAPTLLVLVDLARGRARLGGSVLAQVFGQVGDETPDVDDPDAMRGLFAALAELRRDGLVLAYHDRSDGGLFVTLSRDGVRRAQRRLDRRRRGVAIGGLGAAPVDDLLAALFAEELGAVLQVRDGRRRRASWRVSVATASPRGSSARPTMTTRSAWCTMALIVYRRPRVDLQRAWSETTWQMQSLRDNPDCAQQEYDRILDAGDPGLSAAPDVRSGRGRRGAVRRARRAADDRHPARPGRQRRGGDGGRLRPRRLRRARRPHERRHRRRACRSPTSRAWPRAAASRSATCSAAARAGRSRCSTTRGRATSSRRSSRGRDTFALGVCNGCQMMAALKELIPGAEAWPRFVKNASEQFEARVVMVEMLPGPSVFFAGMAGSRHADRDRPRRGPRGVRRARRRRAASIRALRFVDNRGAATERYPLNPNGSPGGLTGVTTAGRPVHDRDAAPRARVPRRCSGRGTRTAGARTRRG